MQAAAQEGAFIEFAGGSLATADAAARIDPFAAAIRKIGPYVLRMQLILALFIVFTLAGSANAQVRSHGYVSLGAGATDLNGGVDFLIARGPVGIGAEAGAGNLSLASLNGSYHPLAGLPQTRLDPFAVVGLTRLASSERSLTGLSVGGGVVFWPLLHLGLRLDGFKFFPVSTKYEIPVEQLSRAHYWGVRIGAAFRF